MYILINDRDISGCPTQANFNTSDNLELLHTFEHALHAKVSFPPPAPSGCGVAVGWLIWVADLTKALKFYNAFVARKMATNKRLI